MSLIAMGFCVGESTPAYAQTVDVTRPTEILENGVEILLNCSGCKPQAKQIILPKELLKPLRNPVTLPNIDRNMISTDTAESANRYFAGLPDKPVQVPQTSYYYDPNPIYNWVISNTKNYVRPSQEPILEIEGGRAKNFVPPVDGLLVDYKKTTEEIISKLQNNETKVLATTVIEPPTKKLSEINDLGIDTLLSRGESNFRGSPKNRRHNINIGVSRLRGMIIAPGEEFSFNKNICPVDKEGGWLPELVIKGADEGTVPEYGGGLCQVSSTTYRAAMKAGLPITMRKNHSYAVQYYSPQGSDATTYCGGIDFRFKNDTTGSILIWPYLVDKDNLAFDFYGTKDNRVVQLKKPVQYDRKSDGSMKAIWERTVIKDGKEKHDEFKSVYLPPALFHKEEKLDTKPVNPTVGIPPITPPPTIPTNQ